MTALLVALALVLLIEKLTEDRKVRDCTMCSNGVIWSGSTWLHVGGQLEALTEPRMEDTHPAIPATF